jgi:hypothetical protein
MAPSTEQDGRTIRSAIQTSNLIPLFARSFNSGWMPSLGKSAASGLLQSGHRQVSRACTHNFAMSAVAPESGAGNGHAVMSAKCPLLGRYCTSALGLTPPVPRACNAPSSKVVRIPFANQTRDRLDHAASDAQCARQPPRRSADGRPTPTTTRQMALQNAQTNRCGGHRSAYGLSAKKLTIIRGSVYGRVLAALPLSSI